MSPKIFRILRRGLVGLWLALPAGADVSIPPSTSVPSAPSSGQATGPTSPSGGSRGIQIFDDKVFGLSSGKGLAPETSKGLGGTERNLDSDPNYNTEQRENWIRTCEPLKAQTMEKFRECFRNEKQKTLDELRNKFDGAARRPGGEYRNIGPIQDGLPAGEPAFRGVDIEELNKK